MAEKAISSIEKEVLAKWHARKFVAIHRIGNVKVNEISVVVAISTEHCNEAFEACRYAIEKIKTRAPIWKKEISQSGAKWKDGTLLSTD